MSNQPIPSDVAFARGVRFHLQALYACAGIVGLMAIIGVAAVVMAGPMATDPPVTAGVLALLIGGISAIAGAAMSGVGQLRVLKAAQSTQDCPLQRVEGILHSTRRALSWLPKFTLAGCLALLCAYAIWLPAGFWGAVVGTFLALQVAALIVVVRRWVLALQRLHR